MKKTLIITGIVVLILAAVVYYFKFYQKSFSPEQTASYNADGINVVIKYNAPYKKNRVIFDTAGLVPYGKVWRTGANEATTFQTTTDLKFSGQVLKAGTYSLFTTPGSKEWKITFNSEYGQWGINFNGEANRDPKNDVLTTAVPAVAQDKLFEQFTIALEKQGEEVAMVMMWDKTLVVVPFSKN